ncbi:MAG: nucleotide sugar dehydrogenase [Myxococcota bacterium]
MSETSLDVLRRKFSTRDAVVAVIGQGYVGLPLAMEIAEAGMSCIGVDISSSRVAQANSGDSYILDVTSERLQTVIDQGRYRATTDYSEVAKADAISICVPTPLRKTRDPDVSYIQSALGEIAPHLSKARPVLIVLESTTYPGTTDELIAEALVHEGFTLDENVFVAFSPERVDPGNETYGVKNTPKVMGGVTPASTELATTLYSAWIDHIHAVGNAREAEMVKLLENTFRAVNIALVNEMMLMCDRMDINIWSVIDAAATKPFGFMKFTPGPGIGGHCIPLDPTYLSWKAKSYGFYNRFIELATDINGNMPRFVVNKLARLLNDQNKALRGARVMLLGMSYKPNIDDLRESPALDVWGLLKEWGTDVCYHDPYVSEIASLGAASMDLTSEHLAGLDAVIVTTNHKVVEYDHVRAHAPLILDARNAIPGEYDNVFKL